MTIYDRYRTNFVVEVNAIKNTFVHIRCIKQYNLQLESTTTETYCISSAA